MFADVAVELLRMLGASGQVPGAIGAEDIPPSVLCLQHNLTTRATPAPTDVVADDGYDSEADAPVPLAARAVPLIDLLQRASSARAAVMWEAV